MTGDVLDARGLPSSFDLLARDVLLNPHPTYRRLREQDPVHWNEGLGGWVLTSYADVSAALKDHETFSSRRVGKLVSSRVGSSTSALDRFVQLASGWMWMIDPPDHTRVRKLVAQGFTPRAVRRLQPLVDGVVADLVDEILERGEFDLISDFAYQLPAYVLADLFGIPRADVGLLKTWSDTMKIFLGGSPDLAASAGQAAAGLGQMMDYLTVMIRERRRQPKDDLVTHLVQAREENERLTEEELCSNLALVIGASYVTTMDMIGNGLLAMLTQAGEWERLKADPSLAMNAVDEVTRYDGPVQLTHRLLTRDVELRGRRMKAGQLAYLARAAANRDPARFPDPDRLDLTRRDNGHVGLGLGIHYCIGAGLAKVEGQSAFTAFARRVPDLSLQEGRAPVWRTDNLQFRGMVSFPASTGPAPGG
jgi:cytochrome P450